MTTGQYEPELAKLPGIEEIMTKLPPIVKANQIAGFVTPQSAHECALAAGTPVVGGVFDVTAMTLCLADNQPDRLNVILGTWSIVTGISNSGNKPASAANPEWFIKQWKLDYSAINRRIAGLAPAESAVIFLPFLYGTNAEPGMTAGFYGMQAHHTQAHLLQAVYEGVLFSLMTHLERMYQYFPQMQTLRVSGGPTKSAVWLQMLADLSGRMLEVPEAEETGCLGAALMAAEGVHGDSNRLKQHQQLQVIHPNPAYAEAYRKKYRQYRRLVNLLGKMV